MHGRSLALTSAVLVGASAVLAQQDPAAKALVAKARAALGGETRLAALQSFVIKGTIAVGDGPTKDFGSFTVHGRFPDAFVRYRLVSPVGDAGGAATAPTTTTFKPNGVNGSLNRYATRIGFDGGKLIYEPSIQTYQVKDLGPAVPEQIQQLYANAQRECLPLTLGLFVTSLAGIPVRFVDPQGNQLEAINGPGPSLIMTLDPKTGAPVRVGDLVFEDRRDVAGVKVPFRIIRMVGSHRHETWDVKEFQIDVPIPASVFRD